MTSKRAKLFIAIVWTCSALISFPAIIWWRSVSPPDPDSYQCVFTDDIGYLVFSSIISFYGPLTVMIVVYYRIYRAAVNHENSILSGSKNVTGVGTDGAENPVVLRIHKGGFCAAANLTSSATAVVTATAATAIASANLAGLTERHHHRQHQEDEQPNNNNKGGKKNNKRRKVSRLSKGSSTSSSQNEHEITASALKSVSSSCTTSIEKDGGHHKHLMKLASTSSAGNDNGSAPGTNNSSISNSNRQRASNKAEADLKDAVRARNLKAWSMGRKLSKFAKEKKAAKTLGMCSFIHSFIHSFIPCTRISTPLGH